MTVFLEQLVNGLALAGVYLLIALGATLIFGITRLVFFAIGEMVTLGAFLTYTLVQQNVPVLAALVISAIVVGLFAELIDLGLLRRTMARPLNGFVISLGLIVAFEAFYAIQWSGDYYSIPPVLPGTWTLEDVSVNQERVVLVIISLVATAMLFFFLERTHYGRGLRALAEDRVSAQVLGVPVGRMISVVFVIGCTLAGLAGGLLGTIFPFTASFGAQFLLKGFAVALVGGLGNVRGAVIAAVLLGLAETMGAAYISVSWSYAILLGTMVVLMLARPYGLIAGTGRAGDPLGTSILGYGGAADAAIISTRSPVGKALAALPRLSFLALIVVGLAVPFFIGSYRHVALATSALVMAIAVYTVWFGFRFAGIFSNAQASFVGWGAYATAIVTMNWGFNFYLQIIAATVMGAIGAAIFGFVALRASGSYFVILLFCLAELQLVVLQNWSSVTGGYYGLVLPAPANPLFGLVDFSDTVNLYWLVFVFACLVIAFLHWLSGTGFGKILSAVRDNDILAQSLGLDVFRYRLATLIISGACAGLGGALYIFAQIGIEPTFFSHLAAIQLILMMILGGAETLFGPLVGAVLATFLPEVLQISPLLAQLIYGLLLVAIIYLLPAGIVGTARAQYMKYAARLAGDS